MLALGRPRRNTTSHYQISPLHPEKTDTGIPIQVGSADLTGMSGILGIGHFNTNPTAYSFSSPSFSMSYMLTETEPGLTYDLLRPIPVVIEQNDENFVASFTDANIHTSGETASEAFNNLKSYIGDVFDELLAIGRERLGPGPRRELTVLEQYIQEHP